MMVPIVSEYLISQFNGPKGHVDVSVDVSDIVITHNGDGGVPGVRDTLRVVTRFPSRSLTSEVAAQVPAGKDTVPDNASVAPLLIGND